MEYLRQIESRIDQGIGRRRLGYIVLGLVILFFLWFPNDTSQSNYAKTVFISGFFYAIMSSSWALLAGIAGQFSFGHMAFMGIGAYAAGLIARDGIVFAMLGIAITPESFSALGAIVIGTLVAGLVGLVIGWLLLRLRAAYLALFTIAFSELFRIHDADGIRLHRRLKRLVAAPLAANCGCRHSAAGRILT